MGSTIPRHNPPGYPLVDDLTDANKAIWSKEYISAWINAEIKRGPNVCRKGDPKVGKLTQFFDGTVTPYDVAQAGADIGPWEAFPGKVSRDVGQKPSL